MAENLGAFSRQDARANMPKQFARMSTGGKAPRNQLATKAARKSFWTSSTYTLRCSHPSTSSVHWTSSPLDEFSLRTNLDRRRHDIRLITDGAFPGHVPQLGALTPAATALLAQTDSSCTALAKEVRSRATNVEIEQCDAPHCSAAYLFAVLAQHYQRLQVLRCSHPFTCDQMKIVLDQCRSLKQIDLSGFKLQIPYDSNNSTDPADCAICFSSTKMDDKRHDCLYVDVYSRCPAGKHHLCAECTEKLHMRDDERSCPACREEFPVGLWDACKTAQDQANTVMWLHRYVRKINRIISRSDRKPITITMPRLETIEYFLPSQMTIKVVSSAANGTPAHETYFTIKTSTTLEKLTAAYCARRDKVTVATN